jgi:hypothetical protein
LNYEELTKEQLISIHKDTLLYLGEISKEYEDLEKEIERLNNIIDKAIEYIEKDTRWFDSEYAKTYGELCSCAGANDTRLEVMVNPSNLLEILRGEGKE